MVSPSEGGKGMNSKLILPFLLMSGLFARENVEQITIKSYPVKQPKQNTQLSKRKIQKMKGKKARKNRGRNRERKQV